MNNLASMWRTRFHHYMREVQRYAQYIFTGHLAIVLVFAIGALGYSYSEWLKTVPEHFPAAIIAALVISAGITLSAPTTLLKEADIVFFLPLEGQLPHYIKKSLRWTTVSQLPLPLIVWIVFLPLLTTVNIASSATLGWLAVFIIVFKWLSVDTEFSVHFATNGEKVWLDRGIRFILMTAAFYSWLSPHYYLIVIPIALFTFYSMYWKRQMAVRPFPYEHFIQLEQNRMMRFYQFANYFTDVPHVKGAISRRSWLNACMMKVTFNREHAQRYLIQRTFFRTDDMFRLWLRLTVIVMAVTYLVSIPAVVCIFAAVIAFASAIQSIYAFRVGEDFRMDMLYPIDAQSRTKAIRYVVQKMQWVQAILVALVAFLAFGLSSIPIVVGLIVLIVSEITIRLVKSQTEG
ncbi:MAG TPA: ABC transporter permease [Sporosarcina sp.]|nr:ABC transporter permease [Sporosarcina sp.]